MVSHQRPLLIVGNWKMHKNVHESLTYLDNLAPLLGKSQAHVGLAVPFTALSSVVQKAKEKNIKVDIGAQNMSDYPEGPFTGEISGEMLVDVGAQFVILGHSERRHFFKEDNAYINRKVKRALKEGLSVILCIGESLAERSDNQVALRLRQDLLHSLEGIDEQQMQKIVIAYEPIWAIGTGRVASSTDVQESHVLVRKLVEENWSALAAQKLLILYGGSVKPESAPSLLEQEDVDGLLVGGASLSPQSFASIINSDPRINS